MSFGNFKNNILGFDVEILNNSDCFSLGESRIINSIRMDVDKHFLISAKLANFIKGRFAA